MEFQKYTQKNKRMKKTRKLIYSLFPILSLVVIIAVFWWLKLVGITMSDEAFCGHLEHVHNEQCIQETLICNNQHDVCELEEHIHDETCKHMVLACEENHHSEECYQEAYICDCLEHIHDEFCYETYLVCEEDHHEDICYEEICICEEEHEHDETCFETYLVCEENHHEDSCYEEVCVCELEEHIHDETCMDTILICEDEHHNETCYQEEYICGKEEHTHNETCQSNEHQESCYEKQYVCEQEEHVHDTSCYSDITADLETESDWLKTFEHLPKGLASSDMIVELAKTQLDYEESTINYQLDDQGEKRGYTRYGEWYGNPYGEWSTMFTSFVLNYAQIEDVSYHAGAQSMLQAWEKEGRYEKKENSIALKGDIIFLDMNENGTVDKTGIIIEIKENQYTIIIGDYEDKVSQIELSLDDSRVVGFGKTAKKLTMVTKATPLAEEGQYYIGKNVSYSASELNQNRVFVFYTKWVDGHYYALDGNGKAVPVYVNTEGSVSTNYEDVDALKWSVSFTSTSEIFVIQNVKTRQYLYLDYGNTITTSNYQTTEIVRNGQNFKFSNQNLYSKLNAELDGFEITNDFLDSANFQMAYYETHTIWFDGTCGGLMAYGGSADQSYLVATGEKITLPTQWQTPSKYAYKLKGWYDIVRSKYYEPGSEYVVEENTVFYADWVAESYDFGVYNSHAIDNQSMSDYVTIKMFDYNVLFNVMSESVIANINATSHSETWTLVENGSVPYQNMQSLNFIFGDHDQYNVDISYPNNNNQRNYYGPIYSGIYTPELADILFSTEEVIGKEYLGLGDYFLQYNDNPDDEYYGYYYYDSFLNAASYNQSEQRFYIYDYLECTTDSSRSDGDGKYSDFLPLNSPYANLNDHDVRYYTYSGQNGEYQGVNHVLYDARYNTDGSSEANVISNFQYGMSMEIDMYFPYDVGQRAPDGSYGNKDIHGKTMHFKFTGDDDMWVLLDGQLILDLGGVHNIEKGDINFSTGEVTINGTVVSNISGIKAGDHKLTVYYLERGSSQSNCAIYFNLVPRYDLQLQKEDYLTQELLDGAQFAFYLDQACSEPAQLYESKEAHDLGEEAKNIFTIEDGIVNVWGFSSSRTYYIKEIRPPDIEGYEEVHGIIQLEIANKGTSYQLEILEEVDEQGNTIPNSSGYSAYDFSIDEETRTLYLTISNSKNNHEEETSVYVYKEWDDTLDHSQDDIIVYLTLDEEGIKKRIRSVSLNADNDWTYIWEHLPKYDEEGNEYQYGIEEGYFPGYFGKITEVYERTIEATVWTQVNNIQANRNYQLRTSNGVLATSSSTNNTLTWINTYMANDSPLASWNTIINSPYITFVNGEGQILTLEPDANPNYYFAPKEGYTYQGHIPIQAGSGYRLYTQKGGTRVYFTNIGWNGYANASTNINDGIIFQFYEASTSTTTIQIEGFGYKIENIPLEEETSLKVIKDWYVGMGSPDSYQTEQLTMKLYANGKDTGRSAVINLKNNWAYEFKGLPYKDEAGNIIEYSIVEAWEHEDWIASYSDVMIVPGETDTYEVIVTNIYRWGNGYELPSTSTLQALKIILGGCVVLLLTLISILIWRLIKAKGGETS